MTMEYVGSTTAALARRIVDPYVADTIDATDPAERVLLFREFEHDWWLVCSTRRDHNNGETLDQLADRVRYDGELDFDDDR